MSRPRTQTLGSLGRSPARTGQGQPQEPRVPAPPSPSPPPPDDPARSRDRVQRWIHGALFDNVGLKFLSLVLAVTVFLLVNTDRDREIGAEVGVSYTLPDDKVLVSGRIDAVHVTIRGSGRRIARFETNTIPRIDLDLRHAETGEVAITPAQIKLPNGLSIVPGSIHPPSVKVAFERRVDKTVVVTPIASGHPLHGYRVAKLAAEPVVAHGAESVIAALTSIRTTVPVDGRSKSFAADAYLTPPDGITVDVPHVVVQVDIEEVPVLANKLRGVAVAVRGDGVDPAKWAVAPGQVDVTLTGALLSVERAEASLAAVVRVKATETKEREAEVVIDGLPPGVAGVVAPARVKLVPVK